MKLQSILFTLLLSFSVTSQALDQGVQVDLLMNKITSSLKAGKAAEALPAFAQLESMESSLAKPLPESFNYFYIETLDKTGDALKAYSRAEAYMSKYGKKGGHYAEVIEIMSRLQESVEGERKKIAAAEAEARRQVEEAPRVLAGIAERMVSIPGYNYALGKYEVTQAEWRAVMGNNPSSFQVCSNNSHTCGDNNPVEQVSWDDIQTFLQKLNAKTGKQYRLPSEAEWEYACYGGSKTEYCGGNNLDAVGWYDQNSGSKTHQVGQKQANGYGLYDMSGNVWEWMSDCYDSSCGGRVVRGGSWGNYSNLARSAYRNGSTPASRYYYYGFRVARTLP